MSQGGSDTAVVTADTSHGIPQAMVKNQICIIIGDMVKDGHNVEVTKEFVKHGYNVIILYSNIDETNEKEIGSWFDNKFDKQILEIGSIDVKSSENISKVFSGLASKLANDDWSQFEVTVLIYNAALGLVKLVGSGQESKEDEKKDNGKSGLTLQELTYCHDIGAHGFIHCVKEGLKFIDKKSESQSYFHIFYGKASCGDGELSQVIDDVSNYGQLLINKYIKNDSKILVNVMAMPINVRDYIRMILESAGPTFGKWATVTKTCYISTQINGDTYYLTNASFSTKGGTTYYKLLKSSDIPSTNSRSWTLGASDSTENQTYSRCAIAGTFDKSTMAFAVDKSSTGIYTLSTSSYINDSDYEKWRIEMVLLSTGFATQVRLVNEGRNKALGTGTQSDASGTSYNCVIVEEVGDSNTLWTIEFESE